jgi:hypothetical protein
MPDLVHEFVTAACVPLNSGHASGTLDQAEAILAANPALARSGITQHAPAG